MPPNHSQISHITKPPIQTLISINPKMAPTKSFGEGSKKRQKSRAQEEEPAAMDNAFHSFEDLVRFYDEISLEL